MAVDILADALNKIKLYDRNGKRECSVKYSKLLENVLIQLRDHGYVESVEKVEDGKGGRLEVKLKGAIKELAVIKPNKPVKKHEWYTIEAMYLPAIGYGRLIVTTPKGVITNEEAREQKLGGRLIAYVF
ncbi:MAG: 30S ribosomal protein S8 [Methanobacteriota archaeon]|nr:MAG: 30S ribosomal protein S8 [Euryarchaeota archaeon]